jgi:hypothetical protein
VCERNRLIFAREPKKTLNLATPFLTSTAHALAANVGCSWQSSCGDQRRNAIGSIGPRARAGEPSHGRKKKGEIERPPEICKLQDCLIYSLDEPPSPSDECLTAAADSGAPRSRKCCWITSLCTDTRKGCGEQQPGHIWGVLQPGVLKILWLIEIGYAYATVGQVWACPDVEGAHTLWSSSSI